MARLGRETHLLDGEALDAAHGMRVPDRGRAGAGLVVELAEAFAVGGEEAQGRWQIPCEGP